MQLTELAPGAPLSLEMSVADTSYELPSSVISVKQDYILISPLSYNGTVIDLGAKKGMIFSIYAIDPSTEGRIVWKNVTLETISYTNKDIASSYYKISISRFACVGVPADRRTTKRITLNIPGWVLFDVDEIQHQVTIHDVSDHGISFVTLENLDFPSNSFYIAFSDEANNRDFHLRFKCTIVREQSQGLQTFYGCNIPSPSRDFLTYVFLKKLQAKVEAAKAQQEKAAAEAAQAAANAAADAFTSSIAPDAAPAGSGFHSTIRR